MTTTAELPLGRTLASAQADSFWEHGYLHIPEVFGPEKTDALSDEMNRLMAEWARDDLGWTGDWRNAYMDEETEKKSRLIAMHDLLQIHGSYINTTDRDRRMVRVGYRNPENRQLSGQSYGRPGMMVAGGRARRPGDELFSTEGPGVSETLS